MGSMQHQVSLKGIIMQFYLANPHTRMHGPISTPVAAMNEQAKTQHLVQPVMTDQEPQESTCGQLCSTLASYS